MLRRLALAMCLTSGETLLPRFGLGFSLLLPAFRASRRLAVAGRRAPHGFSSLLCLGVLEVLGLTRLLSRRLAHTALLALHRGLLPRSAVTLGVTRALFRIIRGLRGVALRVAHVRTALDCGLGLSALLVAQRLLLFCVVLGEDGLVALLGRLGLVGHLGLLLACRLVLRLDRLVGRHLGHDEPVHVLLSLLHHPGVLVIRPTLHILREVLETLSELLLLLLDQLGTPVRMLGELHSVLLERLVDLLVFLLGLLVHLGLVLLRLLGDAGDVLGGLGLQRNLAALSSDHRVLGGAVVHATQEGGVLLEEVEVDTIIGERHVIHLLWVQRLVADVQEEHGFSLQVWHGLDGLFKHGPFGELGRGAQLALLQLVDLLDRTLHLVPESSELLEVAAHASHALSALGSANDLQVALVIVSDARAALHGACGANDLRVRNLTLEPRGLVQVQAPIVARETEVPGHLGLEVLEFVPADWKHGSDGAADGARADTNGETQSERLASDVHLERTTRLNDKGRVGCRMRLERNNRALDVQLGKTPEVGGALDGELGLAVCINTDVSRRVSGLEPGLGPRVLVEGETTAHWLQGEDKAQSGLSRGAHTDVDEHTIVAAEGERPPD
mmetsp:Transcript_14551/g.31607  ORF Transcript_14551/g.31607 Transcript_14551/m.31607 type:complete len:614 (+) Transcript_14551:1243-3084(+)